MNNPVLVEVTRGPKVESVHRGAICVTDSKGKVVFERGNIHAPVFPRSAVKAIQALPLIESGAADAWGLNEKELSLACSSHSGEAEHINTARSMLAKANISEDALECGGHWSFRQSAMIEQAKLYDTTPPAICNNCSGKHSGFLCTAVHNGDDPTGYIKPDHPVQLAINEAMQSVTGAAHDQDICGTDGCSIPTYAVPLSSMALGFARMGSGEGFSSERAKAAKRLLTACMNEPFYMAGTDRFCTDYMTLGGGRLFAKTGAEGVFCATIPELGLGIALKCDDGSSRGSEAMMTAITIHLLSGNDPLVEGLQAMANKPLKNWNGIEVGAVRTNLAI